MANKIKGLTLEIGGETTGLTKALGGVNKQSRDLQSELREVDRLLKLDPTNTTLLKQKQELLASSIGNTKSKLDALKEAEKQAQAQFAKGDIAEDQYRAIQREVIKTEEELKKLEKTAKSFGGNLTQNLKNAGKSMQDFGGKVAGAGQTLTTKVTLPLAAAGGVAFKFAADLQDAMGASDQVFKTSSDEIKAWADGLESYYGIAESEALTYANTMGAMLQNIGGLSEEEAAKQSQILIELAGDMTAMFGGTTESAVQALTGALKGNNSMLDNYGMGVNEATIKTKALEMGLIEEGEQLDLAGKQAATLALIMEQTADAQGQAAREAEGASGSMRGLTTELKNIAGELGEILLPIITPFIQKLGEIIGKFKELSPETQETIVKVGLLVAAIGPFSIVLGTVIDKVGALIPYLPKLGLAFQALQGPIGIAIAAVAAIIAIGVALYKNWDEIKVKATELMNKISETWDNLKTKTSEAWDNIKTAISDTISGLLTDVVKWGSDIVTGLWNGISEKVEWLKEKVTGFAGGVADTFKSFFGIESPSTLMASFGQYISQGLAQGITENEHLPLDAIKTVGEKMADAARDALGQAQSILNSVNVSSDLSHAAKTARKNRGTYDDYYSGPTKSLQIDYDGNQRINDKSTTINQTNNIYSPKALSPSEIAKEAAKQSMKLVLPLLR